MLSIQQASRIWLPVLLLVATGLVMVAASQQTSAANFIQYGFSQSQTQLSVRVESSHDIKSSQWSYAGPLDNRSDCSNRLFGGLPETIKGRADVTISNNNPKVGRAKLPIQRSDNNKFYCLIIEGYPTVRAIDYNPPTISFEGSNHVVGTDRGGLYGPIGTVDSKSWQATVFNVSRKSSTYDCNAGNSELNFRSTPANIKYVGQYSHGSYNHVSYNIPDGNVQFIVEFFESLENALYAKPETNQALIPFVEGRYSEAFTDNIHLCHRVSDPQGNTTYKLMHLDLGGPAIKLTLTGSILQASSPAVDLDDSSWQYYKIPHRRNRYICDYLDYPPEPTGNTATITNVQNGDWYCLWALDKQGNRNTRLIEVNLQTPPETILPTVSDDQQQAVEPHESTSEQSQDDNVSPLGQQSHYGEVDGNNATIVAGTYVESEQAAAQQATQTPPINQRQPAVLLEGAATAERKKSDVVLQTADGDIYSGGQTFSQTSQTSNTLKYLIFILSGLAAVIVVSMFVFLKIMPAKTKR